MPASPRSDEHVAQNSNAMPLQTFLPFKSAAWPKGASGRMPGNNAPGGWTQLPTCTETDPMLMPRVCKECDLAMSPAPGFQLPRPGSAGKLCPDDELPSLGPLCDHEEPTVLRELNST